MPTISPLYKPLARRPVTNSEEGLEAPGCRPNASGIFFIARSSARLYTLVNTRISFHIHAMTFIIKLIDSVALSIPNSE